MYRKGARKSGHSGAQGRHDPAIHQKGMHDKSPSAVEPTHKSPSVNSVGNTGTKSISTIGPRVA